MQVFTARPLSLHGFAAFLYACSLMKLGSRKHLQQDDLWAVSRRDEAERVWQHFQNCLQASGGVVWRAAFRAYGGPFVQAGVIKVFHGETVRLLTSGAAQCT